MKNLLIISALIAMCGLFSGCVMTGGPVAAPLMLDLKGPGGEIDNSIKVVDWSKIGTAEATGIILFASGDASIKKAMENGGITEIHHVDYEVFNVLNFYVRFKTIVYGN